MAEKHLTLEMMKCDMQATYFYLTNTTEGLSMMLL
jgi:hypothetical protein